MSENVLDIVARLLATENLTVVRDNVGTASFDVVDRVLTMPVFKGMTPVIEEMMVAHEVGHAKHTSWKHIEKALKQDPRLPAYFNVVEDVRIEKHMKREFPGLRKSLSNGYKELNDLDFFGAKKQDPNSYNLIDKINLFFKVGHDCGVDFTDEEYDFVVRAEHTESEQDALDLAKDIFEYTGGQGDNPQQNPPPPPMKKKAQKGAGGGGEGDEDTEASEGGGDGDEDGDGDTDGSSSGMKGTQTGSGGQAKAGVRPNYIESKTVAAFDKAMAKVVDTTTKHIYHTIVPLYGMHPIVPYTKVLKDTASMDATIKPEISRIKTERDESKDEIGYLIKEFEMRKSAEALKRVTISKTGMLDSRKLHAYSLKDDIFRRNSVIPKGKNHGMVFLLDWSGSMSYTIDQVLRQMVDLATFCRRCQIPFEAFAFTSAHLGYTASYQNGTSAAKTREAEALRKKTSKNAMQTGDGRFHLLNLLSHRMTNAEFTTMTYRLLSKKITGVPGYSLGGTPLNEALIFMTRYLQEFRQDHSLEKLSFITMTDGEGHDVHQFPSTTQIQGKTMEAKHWIRNEKLKKDYQVNNTTEHGQTHAILRYLKDMASVTSIGFHIESGTSYSSAIQTMVGRKVTGNELAKMAQQCVADINSKRVYAMKAESRDEMFIVSNASLAATQKTLGSVTQGSSAAAAASALTAKMNGRKRNRVLLDKFIQSIA